jgi:hypothetical protein
VLLWQPLDLAFAPNGDIYIGEGHANESPNGTDSGRPTNSLGAARVIHLDKTAKFINQWYGNNVGQGRFSMVHDIGGKRSLETMTPEERSSTRQEEAT